MAICVLTHQHIADFEKTQERPPCEYHHHTSYKKALTALENDEAIFHAELRAIVIYTCITRYEWKGRSSAGFRTLQLVPVGE